MRDRTGDSGNPQSDRVDDPATPWVVAAVLFLLLALLIWSAAAPRSPGFTPLLWFALIVVLAFRHRDHPWIPTFFLPAATVFVLWFFDAASSIALPFAIALMVSYLLDPLVDRLEVRWGRPRAIILLALPVVAILILTGFFLVPAVLGEVEALIRKLPELRGPLASAEAWMRSRAAEFGFEWQRESLADWVLPRMESLGRSVIGAGGDVWRGLRNLLDVLGLLVITPVASFYLLRDFDRLRENLLLTFPEARRAGVSDFLARVDIAVGAYLRGQLLVGLVQGTLFAVGLEILGVDYAVVVGLSAVVLNLVPFVGSAMTAVLALSVALITDPSWGNVLSVAALYAVLQALDAAVLSPRIVGSAVDLHPLAVMVAILVGGRFFGLPGVLVAVPAAAVARESARVWVRQFVDLLPGQAQAPDDRVERP